MGQQKLGAFIRQIDYLNAKDGNDYENSDDNPGNQLIDVENQCEDISFDELKDAYAAFEEKVCIKGFPERHSPAYWVAYSTVCVLDRLTSRFIDDHEEMISKVSTVQLHALVALIKAGPTTTHTELFDKMINDEVKEYAQTLGPKDLVPLMSAANVTFKYIPNDDCNEYYYGYFQHSTMKRFFLMFSTEQYKQIQKEFLETYIHYLPQIPGLPEKYADHINDLIRDMVENFEEENPYLGVNDPGIIKTHMDAVKAMVSAKGFTEKSPADQSAERTLKRMFKAVLKDGYLPEVFDHLVSVITELNQNENFRKEGTNIYERYIYQLFRSLKDNETPLEKLYKPCVNLVTTLRSQGHMTPMIERLIDEAGDCVIMKVKEVTVENVEITLPMVVELVGSGRKKLIRQAESNLEHLKKIKSLDWKKHVDIAKTVLETIGKIPKTNMQVDKDTDLHDTVSAYRSFLRLFWEQLKKAKVLPQLQSTLVNFIFDCLTIDPPVKSELAEECSGRENLDFSKEESLRMVVLEKAENILKMKDLPWEDRYMGIALSNVLKQAVESYDRNGKKVTDDENRRFMAILKFVGEGGDSVVEHFYEEENEKIPNYKMMIWLNVLLPYARLHQETATLGCMTPILPDIIRWVKIAHADDHDDMMNVCFGVLNWVGLGTPMELKSSLGELIDLMLASEKCNEMYSLVNALYPHNPDAVHSRLQTMFDKLDDMKENERQIITTMFHTVSQKHPEAFTKKQITTMLAMYKKGNPATQPLILIIIKNIAEKHPKNLADFFPQLCDDKIFKPDSINLRSGILACIGGVNERLGQKTVDYLMTYVDHPDPTVSQIVIGTASSMVRKHKDYMQKYKPKLGKLEQTSTVPQVRDVAHDMILVLEGKSVENIVEDIEQQREDIADLDTKVDATMDTVITIGDKVVKQDQEIGELQTGLEKVEERVDDVEEDLGETKVKVEEIDNKTMTNAPKWSRDLTKLMNPTTENDWRLLASRLGYNNDDIRGWATQHDPCMALLSEWYATHKTSEANYGVLTALTEMNRMDGVAIVENAMKVVEGVVEDEEFVYPSPPPVFISYQWGFQNEVKLLKQHLNMAGYECWMDVGQMGGGDKLFAKIDNGIRGAKVVICCVTDKYAQSPNCNREVNLSVNLNKPIIPLLMEKMDWPPVGSMGPIFSEYLFIRFFQRGGEEMSERDQRYWPIPKFQELLMQLNFFVVPDQKMVQKEYAKWWAPMVEDIVIDKSKGKKQGSTQNQKPADTQVVKPGDSPLVFLSYQWGKQPQVKALYQRLTSLGYTVWMDIYQMGGGDSLYDKIDRGMRGCKAVVSCVTQKYSLSANCRREVSLADALKKPLIPLLLEQIKWPPDGPMSMVFTELLYINFSKDETVQLTWKCDQFDELIGKLGQYVHERAVKSDSNEKDKRPAEKTSSGIQRIDKTIAKTLNTGGTTGRNSRETLDDKTKSATIVPTVELRYEIVKPINDGPVKSKVIAVSAIKSSSSKSIESTKDVSNASARKDSIQRNADSKINKNSTEDKKAKTQKISVMEDVKTEAPVKAKSLPAVNKQPSGKHTGQTATRTDSGNASNAPKTTYKSAENEPNKKRQIQRNDTPDDSKSKACTVL